MISPKLPENEKARQKAVEKYKLLDTYPEESYDNITSIIGYITESPVSLITLLDNDRNFFKSKRGLEFSESPRGVSFCGHAILSEAEITIIKDARLDERFYNNPLVTEHNAVFYAGVPLINPEGYRLGTLCVFDTNPRELKDAQINALKTMAKQVVILFEKHFQNSQLLELQDDLKRRNSNLKKFTDIVSHDIKSPLANIIALTDLLAEENKDSLNDNSKQYIEYLKSSSFALKNYVDGLYSFYENDTILKRKKEPILFSELMEIVQTMTQRFDEKIEFNYSSESKNITINKSALLQIFLNLVTNAIKYNNKPEIRIDINCTETNDHYQFMVKDNGNGIPEKNLSTIFDIFSVVGEKDRYGNTGSGVGLATVKKLVNNQDGEITLVSQESMGSTFYFTIAKN